jgi:hypothetical protein
VGNQNITGTITGAGGSGNNAGAFYTGGNTVASFVNAVTINSGVTNAAVVEIGSLNRDILSSVAANVTYKYALAYHTNTTGGDFEIKAITSGASYNLDGTPVSRMYITASGNIGMGTIRPQYNLDVSGTGRFTSDVSINGNLIIGGALSVQQMQSKNVINTTTTNYQLIVSEDLSLNGRLLVSGDASFGGNFAVSPSKIVTVGGGDDGSTPTSGLLRIGMSHTTGTVLQIQKTGATTWGTSTRYDATRYINCTSNADTSKDFNVGPGGVGIGYAPPLYAKTGADGLYVNGRVGVGTNAPAYALDVSSGTGTKIHSLYINAQSNNGTMALGAAALQTAGTFGNGFALYQGTGGDTVLNAASGQTIGFKINNGTIATLNSTGLGIGTTNPIVTLDVAGRARIDTAASTTPYLQLGQLGSLSANTALWCSGQIALAGRLYFYYNWAIYTNSNLYFLYSGNPETGTGGAYCTPSGIWTNASDIKFKNNIENITYGLNEVLQLRPISYNLKELPDRRKQLGFIAQELKEHIPAIVEFDEGNDGFCVSYTEIIPVLAKAIQEQNVIVQKLESENADLKSRLNALEARLTAAGF